MLSSNTDNMGTEFTRMHDKNIKATPVKPSEVIDMNHWSVCTYDVFSLIMGISPEEMKQQFSPRAFSFYSSTRLTYCIVYNNQLPPEHIESVLGHEIGHILYGHVSPESALFGRKDANKAARDALADQFASFLLQHK